MFKGFPNPRVGSSNLSTPAIFKAPVERLRPFSFLLFYKSQASHLVISIYLFIDFYALQAALRYISVQINIYTSVLDMQSMESKDGFPAY